MYMHNFLKTLKFTQLNFLTPELTCGRCLLYIGTIAPLTQLRGYNPYKVYR